MTTPIHINPDDEQLKLEMRAMAELLLDIYEYNLRSKSHPDGQPEATLDAEQADITIKERSTPKSEKHIE